MWCATGISSWPYSVLTIHQRHSSGTIKLFADDTNFFLADKNFHLLKQNVILEISYVQNWADAKKLTINCDPKKSCYSIFKPLNQPFPLNYNDDLPVGTNTIKYQYTTKYLGIILDDQLNWKSYITEVSTKVTKYISIFGKVRQLIPKECLISLYYAFIYSRISYGWDQIYTQTSAKTFKLLQIT